MFDHGLRFRLLSRALLLRFLFPWLLASTVLAADWKPIDLSYQPAPPDNPLKGFVDYPTSRTNFPHSLNWAYFSVADAMPAAGRFDWSRLEQELNAAANRGCQLIPRFYLEFPGKVSAIPRFLVEAGLASHRWTNSEGQFSVTPDYENPRLRSSLRAFIAAFGQKYDGDARIGFVEEGLLGSWGEWHDSPHDPWFASRVVQAEVMDAYEQAFTKTKLVVRYPAGIDSGRYAGNAQRNVGYHDDSFAYATLDTGRRNDSWFFMALMNAAGTEQKWRTQPIGGEVRPEVWDCLFNEPSCSPAGQGFAHCVTITHASWLCNEGVFRPILRGAARDRALQAARGLGYEFHVLAVGCRFDSSTRTLGLELSVTNCGVAPFYYNWPSELLWIRQDGKTVQGANPAWKLTEILPGEPPRIWKALVSPPPGRGSDHRILLRIPNPVPTGRPIRFANRSQDLDLDGYLSLAEVHLD